MKKFWMMTIAIVALGLTTTGCPDGDDSCASDPSLCDPDSDTDSDADTGADADADSDDGTTDETDDNATSEDSTTSCEGWLDPTTSLCWQNPSLASGPRNPLSWDEAVTYCENLSLDGHGPGLWHLPTISELRSLVRGCSATETGGACGVTDACLDVACFNISCDGCSELTTPTYCPTTLDGPNFAYWSSSPFNDGVNTGYLDCSRGLVGGRSGTYNELDVRCVRPGP